MFCTFKLRFAVNILAFFCRGNYFGSFSQTWVNFCPNHLVTLLFTLLLLVETAAVYKKRARCFDLKRKSEGTFTRAFSRSDAVWAGSVLLASLSITILNDGNVSVFKQCEGYRHF